MSNTSVKQSDIVATVLTLATILGAFALVVIIAIGTANFVAQDRVNGPSEIVSASISAVSLFVSVAAITVAYVTISHHQDQSLRQRQMETLHRLNEQYDAVFTDIYRLRSPPVNQCEACHQDIAISLESKRLIYSRYFTVVATGFRYFQLGLVPRRDFVEWTCNLIARFAQERCIVDFDQSVEGSEIKRQWERYEARIYGPRLALRQYMAEIWGAVEKGGWSRLAGQQSKLSATDAQLLTHAAELIIDRAEHVE